VRKKLATDFTDYTDSKANKAEARPARKRTAKQDSIGSPMGLRAGGGAVHVRNKKTGPNPRRGLGPVMLEAGWG
jgi:uncharacterized protein (UPF0254 family)